ncbi:hypothetical protein FBEOM_817 [Fusarium beomiforme]|uniref:Uncharacterized protein n=1 Tax=Fusarium beomiforme TaxID=44412 RepID=A0A9P5E5E8_9HYPO|nr:hypothetical protein FBEOM_817 [Fusarium beomiforme]
MEEDIPYQQALSAVDGLLAYLIYLNTSSLSKESTVLDLALAQQTWVELGRYWSRLIRISSTQDTPNLSPVLNSFSSLAQFSQVAIFTFRNTLLGAKPDSLDAIFSLCSLSYVASCCMRKHNMLHDYGTSWDIRIWRNAIRDPGERQLFSDLASVFWSERLSSNIIGPYDTLGNFGHQPEPYQAPSPKIVHLGNDQPLNNLPHGFWGLDETADLSLPIGLDLQQPSSRIQDLQRSAIVSNVVSFLEECGELLHVFSGRGVTAKGLYSYIAFNQKGLEAKTLVNSYVQRLKNDETFQNLATVGIIAIVERFVALGYLQTVDELRMYMLSVGRCFSVSGGCRVLASKLFFSSDGGGVMTSELRKTMGGVTQTRAQNLRNTRQQTIPSPDLPLGGDHE